MAIYQGEKGLTRSQQGLGGANILSKIDYTESRDLADRLERKGVREDQAKSAAKTKRDKRITNALDFGESADMTVRDQKVLTSKYKELTQKYVDFFNKGGDMNSQEFMDLDNEKKEYLDNTKRAKLQNDNYKNEQKTITDAKPSEFFDKTKKLEESDKAYFGENNDRNVYSDDKEYAKFELYKGIDLGAYTSKWAGSVKEKSQASESITTQGGREYFENREARGRYILMKDGEVVRDKETDEPVPHVTDMEVAAYLNSSDRVRGGFETQLLDESGVNEFKTVEDLARAELSNYSEVYGEEKGLSKGFGERSGSGGPDDPANREDYFFKHLGGLWSGNTEGKDVTVNIEGEDDMLLVEVENSVFEGKVLYERNGKKVTVAKTFTKPGKPGVFYMMDSRGVTKPYLQEKDAIPLMDLMSQKGDYNIIKMNNYAKSKGLIGEKGEFVTGKAYPSKGTKELESIKQQEQQYEILTQKKTAEINSVFSDIKDEGFRLKNLFGADKDKNIEFARRLNKTLENSSVSIDNSRYASPKIIVSDYGNYTIEDEYGEVIVKDLNDDKLEKFFKDSKFNPKRSSYKSNNSKPASKDPKEEEKEFLVYKKTDEYKSKYKKWKDSNPKATPEQINAEIQKRRK